MLPRRQQLTLTSGLLKLINLVAGLKVVYMVTDGIFRVLDVASEGGVRRTALIGFTELVTRKLLATRLHSFVLIGILNQ